MKALLFSLLFSQTSEEFPVCSPIEQYYHGMQLVQANIDPVDLQGQLFYYQKLGDGSILLVRMTRGGCKEEWKPVQSKVFPPPCKDPKRCL